MGSLSIRIALGKSLSCSLRVICGADGGEARNSTTIHRRGSTLCLQEILPPYTKHQSCC